LQLCNSVDYIIVIIVNFSVTATWILRVY